MEYATENNRNRKNTLKCKIDTTKSD
jgi:hypothetical protein